MTANQRKILYRLGRGGHMHSASGQAFAPLLRLTGCGLPPVTIGYAAVTTMLKRGWLKKYRKPDRIEFRLSEEGERLAAGVED